MKRVVRALLLLAALVVGTAPKLALADEPAAPDAEALFQHGVELMKADNCAEAVPEFLSSNALDPSAATLLNLGTCYARLGRKATAWKTYQKAAAAAQNEKNEALKERALQAMAVLGPTLTKVQIVTPKDATPLSLRLNGEVLSDYDGLPIPLDPGQSVIEAVAPGREPWRRTVTADELGATLVIQVPELRTEPRLPPAAQPVSAPKREAAEPRTDYRLPGAVIGGVGLAALITGTAFGLSAQASYNASTPNCLGNSCTQAGIDDRDSAREKAAISTAMFTVGLVAVATGVVLWLVSPSASHSGRASSGGAPLEVELNQNGVMVEGHRW